MKQKINGGIIYKKAIEQISPLVNQYIVSKVLEQKFPPSLENTVLELSNKRKGKNIMRPTLTYLSHQIHGGTLPLKELIPLLAVSELNNQSCYLDNWMIDNKNNLRENRNKVSELTISSEILHNLTQKIIEESTIEDEQKRKISQRLAETSIKSYQGQFLDLKMSIDSINGWASEKEYLEAYKHKSRLQSGHLYGLSGEIGAILANSNSTPIKECLNFLGTGLHISNDLGDFALLNSKQSFKQEQDQQADIINKRLSFPTYFVLQHGTEEEKKALLNMCGNTNATEIERISAAKAIMTSGAFKATRTILNEHYHNFKQTLKQLPDCDARKALSSTGEIIRYNKYLSSLNKLID